jgi:hypothetical protein
MNRNVWIILMLVFAALWMWIGYRDDDKLAMAVSQMHVVGVWTALAAREKR